MRKCVRCSKKFDDTVSYKGKRYCKECLDIYMNSKASCSVCKKSFTRKLEYTLEAMENKDKKKTFCSRNCYDNIVRDRIDLDELDQWLKQYHKTDKLNNRIYMQINQFKSKNNFTYKGILLTLEYVTNTLKKNLELDTIGIVAWYYDNAKEEYIKKIERQEKALKVDHTKINFFEEKEIIFKPIIDNRVSKILITDINFEGGFDDV